MLTHHDSRQYEEAASEAAKNARVTMEAKIEDGRSSASAMIEHVMTHVPQDYVPRGGMIGFDLDQNQELAMGFNDVRVGVHNHALGQIATKAHVPMDYIGKRLAGAVWEKELVCQILNAHYKQDKELSIAKHLVRVVDGNAKGFLSDRYRRLDSRPMVEAFVGSCEKFGLVPIEGSVCQTRVAMKAALPIVFEPVPFETMMLYVEWGNSDFGTAKHSCSLGIWRLWCTNKATVQDGLAAIHLGGELSDSIKFSQKTYELDTATQISALKDVVGKFFEPEKVKAFLESVKTANEKGIEWKHVKSKLQKALLVSEMTAAEAAFDSDDTINLPPTKSLWRASNALSWIAGKAADPERRLQLERIAGKLLSGEKLEIAA